jgi:hypothetical protein
MWPFGHGHVASRVDIPSMRATGCGKPSKRQQKSHWEIEGKEFTGSLDRSHSFHPASSTRAKSSLRNPRTVSIQNTNFTCTHILRMPLSVKSRFRKRDGKPASGPGEPTTLFSGT